MPLEESGDPEFGARIRDLREKAKLPQMKLATAIGVDTSTISRWETGVTMPQIKMLSALAKYLGVSLDYLVNGEQAPAEKTPAFLEFLATEHGQIAQARGWTQFLASIVPPGGQASREFYAHVALALMLDRPVSNDQG